MPITLLMLTLQITLISYCIYCSMHSVHWTVVPNFVSAIIFITFQCPWPCSIPRILEDTKGQDALCYQWCITICYNVLSVVQNMATFLSFHFYKKFFTSSRFHVLSVVHYNVIYVIYVATVSGGELTGSLMVMMLLNQELWAVWIPTLLSFHVYYDICS